MDYTIFFPVCSAFATHLNVKEAQLSQRISHTLIHASNHHHHFEINWTIYEKIHTISPLAIHTLFINQKKFEENEMGRKRNAKSE